MSRSMIELLQLLRIYLNIYLVAALLDAFRQKPAVLSRNRPNPAKGAPNLPPIRNAMQLPLFQHPKMIRKAQQHI